MIEIVDAIQRRKSAEAEVPVGPKHRELRSPVGRQSCRAASYTIERARGQSPLGDQSDIDVAVASAETAMGKAANEIGAEKFGPERRLPQSDNATGKIHRGRSGGSFSGLVRHSLHDRDMGPQSRASNEGAEYRRDLRIHSG